MSDTGRDQNRYRGVRGDRDDRNKRNYPRRENHRDRGDLDRRYGDDYDDRRDRNIAKYDPPSLLVRNLSFNIRLDELSATFSRFGEVRDIYIPEVSLLMMMKKLNYKLMIHSK